MIHPDSEAIFYGILDILAKPGFGFLLILGHNKIDPASLGLYVREPGVIHEKGHHTTTAEAGHNGTNNGTTTTV